MPQSSQPTVRLCIDSSSPSIQSSDGVVNLGHDPSIDYESLSYGEASDPHGGDGHDRLRTQPRPTPLQHARGSSRYE